LINEKSGDRTTGERGGETQERRIGEGGMEYETMITMN
jgi:hypothetical protein